MKYVIAPAMLLALSTAYADDKGSPKMLTDPVLDSAKAMTEAELAQVRGRVTPATPGLGVVTATSAGGEAANAAPALTRANANAPVTPGGGTATAATAGRP
jgi:hypothetical protein